MTVRGALIPDPRYVERDLDSSNTTRRRTLASGSASTCPMTDDEKAAVTGRPIGFALPERDVEVEGLA